jgi:hypothetical protein
MRTFTYTIISVMSQPTRKGKGSGRLITMIIKAKHLYTVPVLFIDYDDDDDDNACGVGLPPHAATL